MKWIKDKIEKDWCDETGILRVGKYDHEELAKWVEKLLDKQEQESYKEGVQFGVKNHDLLKSEWFEYFEYNEETISLQDFIDKKLTNT